MTSDEKAALVMAFCAGIITMGMLVWLKTNL